MDGWMDDDNTFRHLGSGLKKGRGECGWNFEVNFV
jgi:hypothetical protein